MYVTIMYTYLLLTVELKDMHEEITLQIKSLRCNLLHKLKNCRILVHNV